MCADSSFGIAQKHLNEALNRGSDDDEFALSTLGDLERRESAHMDKIVGDKARVILENWGFNSLAVRIFGKQANRTTSGWCTMAAR